MVVCCFAVRGCHNCFVVCDMCLNLLWLCVGVVVVVCRSTSLFLFGVRWCCCFVCAVCWFVRCRCVMIVGCCCCVLFLGDVCIVGCACVAVCVVD